MSTLGEPVFMLPDVRCNITTKNSFIHFEAESPMKAARQRCYSDATHLRSMTEEHGYESDSTAETLGEARPTSPAPLTPTPLEEAWPAQPTAQPYLLDLQPVSYPQQYLSTQEVREEAPQRKKRRDVPAPKDTEITLMVRNIPNKYTPEGLLAVFKEYRACIDFYYLPTDFKNKCNLGYAFVNFCDRAVASRFAAELENSKLPQFEKSEKVLLVQPARVQGFAANLKRFRNSSVMGVLPENCKPMLFENGKQVVFPTPAKKIPPVGPRFRPNGQ